MLQLITFNAGQARDHALAIQGARREAIAIASVLGALGVLFAVVTTALTFRSLRQQARLAADHNRLVELRAGEMEEFAARIAHDLKNPLAAMALMLVASS